MKKILFLVLLGCVSFAKAQNYVTIPDANFAKYLREVVPNAMNGDQLDTSSTDVKNLKKIDAEARAIKNLEGVQYFTALETLDVGNGDVIPDTNRNSFSTLPTLPKNLEELICGNTSLDSLPELPKELLVLKCYKNSINKLPELPSKLLILHCYNNNLVKLPDLPDSLWDLKCSYNMIEGLLDIKNTNLIFLRANNNRISQITDFPKISVDIQLENNQLTNLPTLTDSLMFLDCSGNQLSNLPLLPNKLKYLDCSENHITNLPSLPNSLTELGCFSNNLKIIPLLPTSLEIIDCSDNQLENLPDLPNVLTYLVCNDNQLNSLPKLPSSLNYLYCYNNEIKCFPIFPQTILDKQFNISNNPFSCLPNYVAAMDSITLTYPLCNENDVNNQSACETGKRGVLGYTFFHDTSIANIPVVLLDENKNQLGITYTALNGVYQFVKDSANYHVQIDTTNIPFKVVSPNGNDTLVSFTKNNPFADSVNFNLTCKDGFDVGIRSVATTGIIFPGQPHTLHISAGDMSNWFGKDCAKGISGQLQLTVTGPVKYTGKAGVKNPSINGNVYTYDIADFGDVNFTNDFGLEFITDTTAKADDQICVIAQITPTNGDYNLANNTYNFCYSVINSHDPNLKEVYPAHFKPGYEGYFTYTIHFQNTGNAPAFNIRLLDTLDKAFDLTTFEVLNYSHANRVSLNGNIMNVYFKNIQLQDSTTNEKESHGFIQYRIKPKNAVSESDEIKNTAHIFFDFNEAVVTNTTLSKANKNLSGVEQLKTQHFAVYPNPVKNVINIENITTTSNLTHFVITDIQGKIVYNTTSNFEGRHSVDVSNFTNGVYFIKVESDTYTESVRFVKL